MLLLEARGDIHRDFFLTDFFYPSAKLLNPLGLRLSKWTERWFCSVRVGTFLKFNFQYFHFFVLWSGWWTYKFPIKVENLLRQGKYSNLKKLCFATFTLFCIWFLTVTWCSYKITEEKYFAHGFTEKREKIGSEKPRKSAWTPFCREFTWCGFSLDLI